MRAMLRNRSLALTLAIAVALAAVVGVGTLAPREVSADSMSSPSVGVCSYAGGYCVVTLFAEWGAYTANLTLYGRDVCNGWYYTKHATLYPSPGNPKSAWFWVSSCDRVDAITASASGTISAWQGPFVRW